ncbi:unnamed protein product [Calypogeia fissa]
MRELWSWSWMGTVLAVVGIMRGVLPAEYRDSMTGFLRTWINFLTPYAYFVIPEFEGANLNELYLSVQSYLSTKTATGALVSNLSQPKNAKTITFSLANDQRVMETFDGVKVEWRHIIQEKKNTNLSVSNDPNSDEKRSFKLKVHRSQKEQILAGYFSHISAQAKLIQRENRDLQLYTNNKSNRVRGKAWEAVPFLHPASFDSLAFDPTLKAQIVEDLDEFVEGEEFYRRVGKAWKRGYLLYGPPGTGKSSMIAAIANKLRYDVYDLELTEVESNADLRKLLLQTSNKSIIVIEDIDCSLDLSGQRQQGGKRKDKEGALLEQQQVARAVNEDTSRVTLSGLLNFTDGLWSSCGSERIFIFTTNFVSKLDPALLRPGRMDMHISLSYCTFLAFKVLAKNFLQMKDHRLFPQLEREMDGCPITPAEVAEILTKHKRNEDLALESLIEAVRLRKLEPPPREEEPEFEPQGEGDQSTGSGLRQNSMEKILRPRRLEGGRGSRGAGRGAGRGME